MSWIVRMIVVLPALAALAGLLVRRQRLLAAGIAIGVSAYVLVLAFIQWVSPARPADIAGNGPRWTGGRPVPLHQLCDPLSGRVALAVVLVLFRTSGTIDLTAVPDLTDDPEPDLPPLSQHQSQHQSQHESRAEPGSEVRS